MRKLDLKTMKMHGVQPSLRHLDVGGQTPWMALYFNFRLKRAFEA